MKLQLNKPLAVKEKIGYALGDAGTNIAWRTMATFLLIFYTDVFGIPPAAAGILLLIARLSDGVTDIVMGIIGDRTRTKKGQFRPWILWTAVPFGGRTQADGISKIPRDAQCIRSNAGRINCPRKYSHSGN